MLNPQARFAALGLFMLTLLPSGSCDFLGLFPSPAVHIQLGQVFQISMGQTALLPTDGLSVTFKDVLEDSRCPVDVVCVWAGNAKVTLDVQQTGKATQTLALNSTLDPREAAYEGYRIRFEDLMPQPRSDRPIRREDYRLSLSITK
ncbi:MAG: hypothetical protein A2Z21_03050 [Candidatus Fraserbacteria bacterium RBG_16_55_9]|uniref:Uncharacterized protein n=1 Tax=Fraserbacteria sp. (strain RBG_16_55_9) TaxID=1817864 RepID=A0A1F5UVN5_FRAXR|nr:MAG: hypothetical protein A2Z21_03050 [Candidatus Fraserbacteria bacterium RBG_16_55_9]